MRRLFTFGAEDIRKLVPSIPQRIFKVAQFLKENM